CPSFPLPGPPAQFCPLRLRRPVRWHPDSLRTAIERVTGMTYRRTLMMFAARMAIGTALLAGSTGCAGFSLKSVWAVTEDTPMQAVVRRADSARATATNVDRLMSGTAVDDDSKWVPTIPLKKADAEAILNAVAADPEYKSLKGGKLRIVNAEAWAQALSKLCPSESKSPSLLATISDDVNNQYADIASQ